MAVQKITDYKHSVTLDQIEATMLEFPQVECPVSHHFGPGIYIREVVFPAGIFVIGHAHKQAHTCVMPKGKMAIITGGDASVIEGPMIFTGQPGRKLAYVMEETVFQNIFATDETNLKALEDMFIEKSPAWLEHHMLATHRDELLRVAS
jgi:hypothetical protein